MILELTGMERGAKTSRAGKTHTGLTINGIQIDRDGNAGDAYEKFIYDWKNPDEITVLEEAGVGATVSLVNERDANNSKFWNLVRVDIMEEGDGTSATPPPSRKEPAKKPAKTAGEATGAAGAMTVEYQAPKVSDTRVEALKAAVNFTDALLSSDERFKKLMPATKTTVEIVSQMTLENAAKFESFIKNGAAEVKSDTSDLNSEGVDASEPTLPGDDD